MKGRSVVPAVKFFIGSKFIDIGYDPIYFFCLLSQPLFCFVNCDFGYIQDGYVGKTSRKQVINQIAVSSADINDRGIFWYIQFIYEIKGNYWCRLVPTYFVVPFGGIYFFPV